MSSQAEVNAAIIETLQDLSDTDLKTQGFISRLVDKQVEVADILLAMSERLEMMVDLITTHVDNHEVDPDSDPPWPDL